MTSALLPASTALPNRGQRPTVRYSTPVLLVISAFIVLHVSATLLWVMPDSAMRRLVRPVTWNYISHVGLWQSWGMFAPEPSNLNYYLSGVITYRDGSQREAVWPRMREYNLLSRYQKERYRKFSEYTRMDQFAFMWPSFARFIAQSNDADAANPPVRMQLYRSWSFIPPPPNDGAADKAPAAEWNRYQFFETAITPKDLER